MPTTDEEKLIISLEARLSKYEREMKRATQISSQTARKIENDFSKLDRSMGRMGAGMKSFGAGLIGGLSAQALGRIIVDAAKAGAAIGDLSEQIGMSAEKIQILQHAANQTGSSADQMSEALKKFALETAKAATTGGDLKDVLDANGVAIEGNANLFEDYLRLIRDAPSDIERVRLIQLGFGRGADELLNTLRQGPSVIQEYGDSLERLGGPASQKTIDALGRLDDKFAATMTGIKTATLNMAANVEPVINAVADEVLQFVHQLEDIVETLRLLGDFEFSAAADLALRGREAEQARVDRERLETAEELARVEQEIVNTRVAINEGGFAGILNERLKVLEEERKVLKERQATLDTEQEIISARRRLEGQRRLSVAGPGGTTVVPGESSGGKSAADLAAGLIAEVEGFVSKAFFDTNAFRVGFSSDTMTSATGEVTRTTAESVSTVADAWRDLNRRIAEAQVTLIEKLGAEAYNRLTEGEKAALTSVLYHHGAGGFPSSLVTAAQSGAPGAVAAGIEALPGFRTRHLREASVAMGGDVKAYQDLIAADEKAADAAEKRAEEAAELVKRKREDLEQILTAREQELAFAQLELDYTGQSAQALEEQRVFLEEINRLKAAGLTIDEAAVARAHQFAEQLASVHAAQLKAEEAQTATIEQLDAMRDLSSDVFGGIISDLRAGASAGEIFANVLDKILSKLGDMAVSMLTEALFGAAGTAGTGLLGSLFGGLIPGRQHGGAVEAGSPYVVGERQPELFVPNVSGRIMPSVPRMGGASASIVNGQLRGVIDINPSPLFLTSVAQTSARMIAENNRRMPAYLADRQRRGI